MNLLLDPHPLRWFALGDAQLSATARQLIEDPANTKFVSPATYWEIAIKISIGKYVLHQPYELFFDRAIRQNGFLLLPIEVRHTVALTTLPSPRSFRPLVGRASNGRRNVAREH